MTGDAGPKAHDNVLRVQVLWRALSAHVLDSMLRIADEEVVWLPAGSNGRRFHGHAGLRDFMAEREAASVDERAHRFTAHGENVLVFGTVRTPDAAVGEERQMFWVYTFRDGRLARFEAFEDHHAATVAALTG